ncbi:ECF RNA polymerase sigma factor SigK [Nakamurella leprariae]|uniref:ECF RNA polymerase sigma factor SigK n=1 Tax=Nakamurella leprariae TaxID=2803911 RepID=A0A938Y6G4_9ACTN|nr:ECF RNA polymerase sigma factor SigK [Nakamurella leprariae]MBM9466665.1 ECF RNA polymerase sigma factor SigK [Nakamurella leprariae]
MTPPPRRTGVPAGDPPGTSAEDLLQAIAGGGRGAFEELYDRFAPRIYGMALRVVRDASQAEEVAQEVLLEVWRRAARFDAARGSAAGWILRIAHARAVDRVRSAQASSDREQRSAAVMTEREVDTVSETVERTAERTAVRRCLETLTALQREAILLAYYGGLSYPEVAGRLDTPLGTIKTRMRDGLIRLRGCLEVGA